MTGPCHWEVDYCSAPEADGWGALSPSEQAKFENMATEYLWRWTGRMFGLCEVRLRPCKAPPERPSTFEGFSGSAAISGGIWHPVLIGGKWFNISCGACGSTCDCDSPATLRLPGPVASVAEVLIDGVALDPSAYRVDNKALLVRQDGGAWPTSQDMGLPSGALGTFEVTYNRGVPVPVGGQIAAGVLAIELYKASCNDGTCALPKRVQTVTRQGVSIAMIDSFDNVNEGRTGIWVIDSWLASITQPTRSSFVLSPDLPRHRATSWRPQP